MFPGTSNVLLARHTVSKKIAFILVIANTASCDAQGMRSTRKEAPAYETLFNAVEKYFSDSCTNYTQKIRRTNLPSIYFQHAGMSSSTCLLS